MWEDKIWKVREFIQELSKVQEVYFNNLFEELNGDNFSNEFESKEEANEWLFDYIFNGDDDLSFEEYLANYGKQIGEQ